MCCVLLNLSLCKRLIISCSFIAKSPEHNTRVVIMLPYHIIILYNEVLIVIGSHSCTELIYTRSFCLHNYT